MKIKSIISVAVIFSILFAFNACRKLESSGEYEIKEDMIIVDDLGETHEVETTLNEDTGETEFYYTDDLGNVVVVSKEDVGTTTALAKVTTTGPNGETEPETYPVEVKDFLESISDPEAAEQYYEEVDTSLEISDTPINTDNMQQETPPLTDQGVPVHQQQQQFVDSITKSNQYSVDITIKSIADGVTTVIPAKFMRSGNNIFAEVQFPVQDDSNSYITVRVLVKDGKCIMYLPKLRAFMEVPYDTISEVTDSVDRITKERDSEEYQKSGQVTVNGTTYDVDIYEEEDGTTVKYYFEGDTLKRMESTAKDGSILIVEYNNFSSNVDKSKFVTPTGYFNLGNLENSDDILNYLG